MTLSQALKSLSKNKCRPSEVETWELTEAGKSYRKPKAKKVKS